MKSILSTISAIGLATIAQAFTPPTTPSWGSLLTPDTSHPVTQGETFTVTWDPSGHPTDGVTVSLVLCNGPSSNCVTASTAIVEKVPAAQKSYDWAVPCDLPVGTQNTATGYGMLIIVDGTGEFQYSTQFSVLAGSKCSGSTTSSSSTWGPTTTANATIPTGKPTNGTKSQSYYISGGATWAVDSTTTSLWGGRPTGGSSTWGASSAPASWGSTYTSAVSYSTSYATVAATTASGTSSSTASSSSSLVSQFNAAPKVGANANTGAGIIAAAFAVLFL